MSGSKRTKSDIISASIQQYLALRGIQQKKWKITDKPTVNFGSSLSIEYLSVNITAEANGHFLDQRVYCNDLLCTWPMVQSPARATAAATPPRWPQASVAVGSHCVRQ